ncbi:MAG: hypothetical protein ACOCXH_07125 [Cyclobacteriaceae bacterium]
MIQIVTRRYTVFTIFAALIFSSSNLHSQSVNAPLADQYYHLIDRYEIKQGKWSETFHSSVKAYQRKAIAAFVDSVKNEDLFFSISDDFNLQYLANDNWEWYDSVPAFNSNPVFNTFYRVPTDFYHVDEKDFDLHINPVLYLQAGTELDSDITPYLNTRGLRIRGMIGQRLGFFSFLSENQAIYPSYVRSFVQENRAIPGQGYYKRFKENGQDYFSVAGYISFDVVPQYINLQFGHDKFFIGNGHRSLILSDASSKYLFLKLNTRIWKFNYTNLFTELRADAFGFANSPLARDDFPRKYMTFHHLSLNIGKKLNIGVFESIVFGEPDSLGNASYELSYLNPVIFYRAIEHQNGSLDNAILGADFKWLPFRGLMLYGQWVFDEFLLREIRAGNNWWANKFAYQLGIKKTDLLIDNLDLQLETNRIRPYTYGHQSIFTNYAHYRQPLAHPMGANLQELTGILRYQPFPRFNFRTQLTIAKYGADTLGSNWGKDVMQSYLDREQDYGNVMFQGVETNLTFVNILASYQVMHNLFLDAGVVLRRTNNELGIEENQNILNFALRWNIGMMNMDF